MSEYTDKQKEIVRKLKEGQIIRFVTGSQIKKNESIYNIKDYRIVKMLDEAIEADKESTKCFRTAIVEPIEITNRSIKKISGGDIMPYCSIITEDGQPVCQNKIISAVQKKKETKQNDNSAESKSN